MTFSWCAFIVNKMKDNHENRTMVEESKGRMIGGTTLVWLGISFLLTQSGLVPSHLWWMVYTFGLGGIFMLGAVSQYMTHGYTYETRKAFIFAGIFFVPGFFILTAPLNLWPVILVVIGASLIFSKQ